MSLYRRKVETLGCESIFVICIQPTFKTERHQSMPDYLVGIETYLDQIYPCQKYNSKLKTTIHICQKGDKMSSKILAITITHFPFKFSPPDAPVVIQSSVFYLFLNIFICSGGLGLLYPSEHHGIATKGRG